MDPYQIVGDKSKCVDQQTLKLQETPEMVPTGELPRHILLSVDRSLTNLVVPGTRVTVLAIYATFANRGNVCKNTLFYSLLLTFTHFYSLSLTFTHFLLTFTHFLLTFTHFSLTFHSLSL